MCAHQRQHRPLYIIVNLLLRRLSVHDELIRTSETYNKSTLHSFRNQNLIYL